jgi:hypothetical protein
LLQRHFHRAGPPAEGGKARDDDKKEDHQAGEFPEVHDCFMIYGGQAANASARHRKQEHREVCSVKVAAPVYLDWSDKPITFDQADHPDHVPSPGKYPLVVDPIIGDIRLTKVLMDGRSSLNIIYAETLGLLHVDLSSIRAGAAPFHGNIPGKRVQPLGQLDLSVCFGTPSNFRRETLTFEVVGFRGTYHAVLGRPCYTKFMAVPNYTYLKLKMPGPNGVITVGPTYKHAFECDVECVEYAEALIADLESLSKEVPDVKRHAGNIEPAETVKSVPLDPSSDASKQVRIGSELGPKQEAVLVDFLRANADVFAWSPSDMPGIPRDVAEHSLDIRAGARPVKKPLCRFDGEKRRAIGEEIHKLVAAGFIEEVKGVKLNPEKWVFGMPQCMFLGFIVSKRGIEANPEKIATIAQHPEPLLGALGGYTHPWEGPLVIAKVLKPGTYKLANRQGEVYGSAWNIQQLRHFYP